MIDHYGINVADRAASSRFYDSVLGVLGYTRQMDFGVAVGYVGRPDLTAEKFVLDEEGRRTYKTGDLGRFDENGNIAAPPKNLSHTASWWNAGPKPGSDAGKAVISVHTYRNGGALGNDYRLQHMQMHAGGQRLRQVDHFFRTPGKGESKQILAVQRQLARGWSQPGHCPHQRGLSATVGAE